MTPVVARTFKDNYANHLQHLKLKGLQPKTIDAYSRSIRCIGAYFKEEITHLTEQQLINYFVDRLSSHSWSAVKNKRDRVLIRGLWVAKKHFFDEEIRESSPAIRLKHM